MEAVRNTKGKRCPNFTKVEEKLLLQLVAKYGKEVECKRSDTDTNKIKAAAWNRICKEFNSVGNIQQFRDAVSLRKKYENYKKVLKQKRAANRKTFYKTGGGPSSPSEIPSETDDIVSGIISSQVDGFNSEFDSDVIDDAINNTDAAVENDIIFKTPNTSSIEVSDTRTNEQTTTPNIIIISDTKTNDGATLVSGSIDTNWGKYTPQMLKNAKHKALNTGLTDKGDRIGYCRTGDLKSKLGQWAAKKQLYVRTQEECFIREHELTMAHKKEKHALEMKHAEELHQNILQQMREKHKREMDKI